MFRAYLGPSPGGKPVYTHNNWYLLFFDYNPTRTTDSHLKRIINTICCIHTVVPPDDGHAYARNM